MTILISNEKNIRIISLNRPEKLNAITLEMATELNRAIQDAANDSAVKCLVITGEGRAFSSGGDVDEMGEYLPKAGDLFYKLTEQIHNSFSSLELLIIHLIVALVSCLILSSVLDFPSQKH